MTLEGKGEPLGQENCEVRSNVMLFVLDVGLPCDDGKGHMTMRTECEFCQKVHVLLLLLFSRLQSRFALRLCIWCLMCSGLFSYVCL